MIGKILKVEMPQLQKGASYGRALVFSFAILGLAEILLAVMFAFGFVSGNEMLWFTIYIVALSFLAPLGLRMSGWKLVALLGVACLLWIGFAFFQQVFDRCCVQKILMSYARGENYRIKERQVSWFASSSAMAYVRFFISETDYLKRCAQEISSLRTEAEDIQKLHRIDFRNRVEIRRKALVENFLEAGYSNKTTVAALKMFQGKYERILKVLQEVDRDDQNVQNK